MFPAWLKSTAATILAIAAAPVPPALMLASSVAMDGEAFDWALLLESLLGSYIACGLVCLVIGLPGYVVVRLRLISRWWSFAGVGAATGAAFGLLIGLPHFEPVPVVVMGVVGGCSGLSFWVVWRIGGGARRPTSQVDPKPSR